MTLVQKLDPESEFLSQMWDSIDWRAAEDRLADLQQRLAKAAADFDRQTVIKLQGEIASDLDCRCLAVRKVAKPHSGPGIDGVRWTTSGQKMTGALALTPVDYRAKPQRLIELKPHKGRSRRVKLSTYHDRAMATLYSFTLAPVTEASAERKSFAFRKGRSAHDAVKYITDMFSGASAPKFVLVCDVKAYYANISHEWLMAHAPMDKDVLREGTAVEILDQKRNRIPTAVPNLEDDRAYNIVRTAPADFAREHPGKLVIDEAQRALELFSAIQVASGYIGPRSLVPFRAFLGPCAQSAKTLLNASRLASGAGIARHRLVALDPGNELPRTPACALP